MSAKRESNASVCLHEQALITNTSRYTDAETLGAAAPRNVPKASSTPNVLLPPLYLSLSPFASLGLSPHPPPSLSHLAAIEQVYRSRQSRGSSQILACISTRLPEESALSETI